jgi:hypothetical protein
MATGNAFEIFRVDAIDAGALLHQIAGPGAGVRIALLIGEAGGATHSGGRRRAAFPRAGRVDARLRSLQKNVRTFRPSCLVSQTTLALENSSAAGSPCNLAGGATAPADETKENTANSPAATKAARLPHARLVHAGISVPPTPQARRKICCDIHIGRPGLSQPSTSCCYAQHKDVRVRHKRLFQNRHRHFAASSCEPSASNCP